MPLDFKHFLFSSMIGLFEGLQLFRPGFCHGTSLNVVQKNWKDVTSDHSYFRLNASVYADKLVAILIITVPC